MGGIFEEKINYVALEETHCMMVIFFLAMLLRGGGRGQIKVECKMFFVKVPPCYIYNMRHTPLWRKSVVMVMKHGGQVGVS